MAATAVSESGRCSQKSGKVQDSRESSTPGTGRESRTPGLYDGSMTPPAPPGPVGRGVAAHGQGLEVGREGPAARVTSGCARRALH